MDIECDVAVVGAGPAGSVTALYCSNQGLDTILIEKNEGIGKHVHTKIDASTDHGLTKIIKELDLKTHNYVQNSRWHSPSGNSFTLHSKTGEYYFKRGSDKDSFECSTVKKAVEKGCNLLLNSTILDIKENEERLDEITVKQGGESHTLKPKIIIAADGGNSTLHRFVTKTSTGRKKRAYGVTGLNFTSPDTSEIHFDSELIPGGYFYIATCTDGTSSAGIVLDSDETEKSVKEYYDNYLRKTPKVAERIKNVDNSFAGQGELFDLDTYHYKNLLFVGDAAGLIDPFLGYGMMPAITSGYIAGEYCNRLSKEGDYSKLNDYNKELKERFDKDTANHYWEIFNTLNKDDLEMIICLLNELQDKVNIDELIDQLHS